MEQLCNIFPRISWTTLENGFRFNTSMFNTRDEKQQQKKKKKNISDLKNANLKKDAVSSIYPRILIDRYLSVTEKSNTNDVTFPQASVQNITRCH